MRLVPLSGLCPSPSDTRGWSISGYEFLRLPGDVTVGSCVALEVIDLNPQVRVRVVSR